MMQRPDESARPAEVQELVRAAVDYVQRAIGCRPELLDLSEESLAFVDHYISQVRDGDSETAPAERGTSLRPEVRALVASALGAYLGEVLIARFGGGWVTLPGARKGARATERPDEVGSESELGSDPREWRLELTSVPIVCDPIGMAAAALRPIDELAHEAQGDDAVGFAVPKAYAAALREALARVPPVELEYFYSLTGRFETLSYAADILADLKRQDTEQTPAEDLPN